MNARWAARQRAQQNLPKSLRLYSGPPKLARRTLETLSERPTVVLDSNVVLDWLVFRDPTADAIGAAITAERVRWIATPAMRSELEHVLTVSRLLCWKAVPCQVLAEWDRWARTMAAPLPAEATALRCTDPDDQKFIDLALHAGASALLSRDRAVLALAARARRRGLTIQTAAAWTRSNAAP